MTPYIKFPRESYHRTKVSFIWANCYCGIEFLWPKEMHGQCFGFINTLDGLIGFLPVALFGRKSNNLPVTTGLLILGGLLVLLTAIHVTFLYRTT